VTAARRLVSRAGCWGGGRGGAPVRGGRAPGGREATAWGHRARLVGFGVRGCPAFRCLQRVERRAPVDDEVHGPRTRAGWHPRQRDLSGGSPYPDDGGGRSPLGCPLQRLLSATLRSNPDGARRRSG